MQFQEVFVHLVNELEFLLSYLTQLMETLFGTINMIVS